MSLRAWYKLDDNINDEMGSFNGTPTGTQQYTTGKINRAMYASTTFKYVDTGYGSGINMANNPHTFSMWVKPDLASGDMMFFGPSNGTNQRMYLAKYTGWWDMGIQGSAWGSGTRVAVTTNWTHITLRMDGSIAQLFVNGEKSISKAYTSFSLDRSLWFGDAYASYQFVGAMDDIRIYDHALSDHEIKELSKAKILHYQLSSPYEEPTQNLSNGINTYFSAWGTPVMTGTSQYFDAPAIGQKGIYVNCVYNGNGGVMWRAANGNSMINVTPSTVYTMSAFIKFNVNPSANLFYLRQYRSDNSQISESGQYSVSFRIPYDDGWFLAYRTFTTHAECTKVVLQSYEYQTNEIWMHSFQFEQKDHTTPFTSTSRNGMVQDISGYENNGTIELASSPDYRVGKMGLGSYQFLQKWISLPNDVGYREEFSAFGWFKSNGTPGSGFHILFGGSQLEISIPAAGQIRNGIVAGTRQVFNNGSGLTDGNWHHLGIVYNGSNLFSYIDGNLVGTNAVSGTLTTSFNRRVGVYGTDLNYHTNGWHDDIRIYATALSTSDVKEVYQSKAILDTQGNLSTSSILTLNENDFSAGDFNNNFIHPESILKVQKINEVGITDGLVVWYPLNGDALEYSGALTDGTFTGTPTISNGVGKYKSYEFISGQRINIDVPQLTGDNYTFSAWVNKTSNNSITYNMFMGNLLPYFSYQDNNSFFFSAQISGTQRSIQTPGTYTLGQWHHYVATYDGTSMKIFVNGVEAASANWPGTMTSINTNFAIGDGQRSTWYPFIGRVSDVRIFNRVLTNNEISILYNQKQTPLQFKDNTAFISGEFKNE
jgi:hypothetical protein